MPSRAWPYLERLRRVRIIAGDAWTAKGWEIMSLNRASYVSLATFRKSGVEVATAVWGAEDAGDFYIFSAADAGKVKRLRNSDRARLAVCDAKGKVLGHWHDASAGLIADSQSASHALATLRAKYGWQMVLTDFFSKLSGRFHKRVYIRVRLAQTDVQQESMRKKLLRDLLTVFTRLESSHRYIEFCTAVQFPGLFTGERK